MKVHGWAVKIREHGKIIFIDLRSPEFLPNIIQVVCKDGETENFDKLKDLTQESSLVIDGEIIKNERAPQGFELHAKKVEITSLAQSPYPLGKKEHNIDFLMKVRHLTIRSPRYTKIWYFRSQILKFFREWLDKEGWIEVSPPIFVKNACEGGSTLFEVKWFDNDKAYLSQSAQLYLEALIFSLGKVWSLTPSFRAEKSRTKRHLSEYWHLELEGAWMDFEDLFKTIDEIISYTIQRALEEEKTKQILKEFRGELKILEKSTQTPYPRIHYNEAIEILQKKGVNIEWGEDLGSEEEKVLTMKFETPIHLHHFPKEIKAFYMKIDRNDPKTVLGTDLLLPEGYGEVVGASVREDDYEILKNKMIEQGLNPKEYGWYLDLRKYGSVPHVGLGLGIDRFIRWLLKLDHIRDTLPFPRLARDKEFI